MEIVNALKYDGVLYDIGDYVKLILDNGRQVRGKIRFFGDVTDRETCSTDDCIEIGRSCVYLSDVKNIIKITK